MTRGVMKVDGANADAVLTEDGWASDDVELAELLNGAFPVVGTAVGDPVCRAFAAAVDVMGERAAVVEEPQPGKLPPGSVQ